MKNSKHIYRLSPIYRLAVIPGGLCLIFLALFTCYVNIETIFDDIPFLLGLIFIVLFCFVAISHAFLFKIVVTNNYIKKRIFFQTIELSWENIKTITLPFSDDNKTVKFILTSKDGRRIIVNPNNIYKGIYLLKYISKIIEKPKCQLMINQQIQ